MLGLISRLMSYWVPTASITTRSPTRSMSGLTPVLPMPAFCASGGLSAPADLYLEGSDQHRGWFQSSLLTGIGAFGESPYRQVLTHGFTVDGEGRKMSKSLGNIIPAKKAMNDIGADVLRLWVSSADYRNEIAASDEIFKRTADAYRRIRNTARFLLANLAGFDPSRDQLSSAELLPLDRWIIRRAAALQAELLDAYETYQFHHVYHKVHNFCSGELGGFYLDVIKDRQYTTQADSQPRRSAQTALYHLAEALACWIARYSALPPKRFGRICRVSMPHRYFSAPGTSCRAMLPTMSLMMNSGRPVSRCART